MQIGTLVVLTTCTPRTRIPLTQRMALQLCSGLGPDGTFLLDSEKSCSRLLQRDILLLCLCRSSLHLPEEERPRPSPPLLRVVGGGSTPCPVTTTTSAPGIRRPWQLPAVTTSTSVSSRSMNPELSGNLMVVAPLSHQQLSDGSKEDARNTRRRRTWRWQQQSEFERTEIMCWFVSRCTSQPMLCSSGHHQGLKVKNVSGLVVYALDDDDGVLLPPLPLPLVITAQRLHINSITCGSRQHVSGTESKSVLAIWTHELVESLTPRVCEAERDTPCVCVLASPFGCISFLCRMGSKPWRPHILGAVTSRHVAWPHTPNRKL